MSIREKIIQRVKSGELMNLESSMFGEETARTLFVSRAVFEAVSPPFPGGREMLHAEFREMLDAFLENGELTVGESPDTKDAYAQIARVAPVADEFWDFRIISPRPQIRAFGGFAEKDVFVLLTWDYRDNIGDNFDAAVDDCRTEWRRIFGADVPFHGRTLDDYLSNVVSV